MGLAVVLASASAAAPAAWTPAHWCKARATVAWQRVLSQHVVAISKTTPMVPVALARDGHSFFAEVYSRSFSGVARIDARTDALHKIKAFPDPQFDQAWGAFDGRWLVWNEYRGYDNFNDFTTWAWDTQKHKLSEIGAATKGPDGQFWESPWRGADVRDGIAEWVQGVGPNQLGDVHVYDLRTGADRVVRRGHPGGGFLLGHHIVVWPEASTPGVPTRMHAASATTGARVLQPRALRNLRNVTGLQTDGSRIAYPNAPYKSLWWSPSLRSDPYEAVRAPRFHHVDNSVQVAGRYVSFGMYPGVYVAEPKLHRYIELTGLGGTAMVNSAALLLTYAPAKKALHAILRMALVPLRDLPPMPACS